MYRKYLKMAAIAAMAASVAATACSEKDDSDNGRNEQGQAEETVMVAEGVSLTMVSVPGGKATLNGTEVTLSDFQIGKYEVTEGQWEAVMGNNPSEKPSGRNFPVESVSWNDVQEFITMLNAKTDKHFRLPTEAEWEYAARGGQLTHGYKYSGSDNLNDVAWYYENSDGHKQQVGTKSPNELGIYDMSGNVWEWCGDWYGNTYPSSSNNPTGPDGSDYGFRRVIRGGGGDHDAGDCSVSYRSLAAPENRFYDLGFRLVLVP